MLTHSESRAQIARRGRRWCLTGDSQVAHKRIHVMTHTSTRSNAPAPMVRISASITCGRVVAAPSRTLTRTGGSPVESLVFVLGKSLFSFLFRLVGPSQMALEAIIIARVSHCGKAVEWDSPIRCNNESLRNCFDVGADNKQHLLVWFLGFRKTCENCVV